MSVRFHEAVSFDSTKYRLDWRDDFWGDSLDAMWRSSIGGGGTMAVTDAVDGGIVRIGTPTASDSSILYWNDIRTLHVNKRVSFEARVRDNGGVTDTYRQIRMYNDGDDYIGFYHNQDSDNIYILSRKDATQTALDSGIDVDTAFHVYKIECFPAGEVHYYIDGVETANSPITTNIPDDVYLQPYIAIISSADSDPATSMDIDYVYVRQER